MKWLWIFGFASAVWAQTPWQPPPRITPVTAGPYHVRGNRILNARADGFLIRGTRLPPVPSTDSANSPDFGAFSGTTFITIRQRLNMNAVRLGVNLQQCGADAIYTARIQKIIQQANRFGLLAILDLNPKTTEPAIFAWANCASEFKTSPDVLLALPFSPDLSPDLSKIIASIRSAGVSQPIIIHNVEDIIEDPNTIYEVSPSYASLGTSQARIRDLSDRVPVLVDGLDPQFDIAGHECTAFPAEPAAASNLVEGLLKDYDEQAVSWTISAVEPGRLLDNFRNYNWTKLDEGWTCGADVPAHAGIAMAVLSHLWSANPHGIFTVNQPAGGMVVARGANSSAYGRTMAQREARPVGSALPVKLGDVSIRIRDFRGVARLARLMWAGGGWSNINFVVPEDAAPGPAEVAVLRSDGSKTVGSVIIADVAPALWTATHDGRGPVIGQVSQRFPDGRTAHFAAWECSKDACHTRPIPLAPGVETTLCLEGTGFRFASSKAAIRVEIDGISIPAEAFGPLSENGRDQVTIRIPGELAGHGETDLFLIVDGALSNVVRIHCGREL